MLGQSMKTDKNKKISKGLLVRWIVCYVIFSIGSSIYISYQQVINGNDPTVFVSELHWFTLGINALYFLPLMCVIHYLMKKAGSSKLHKVVTVILIWLGISTGLMFVSVILAYAAPEFFEALTLQNQLG